MDDKKHLGIIEELMQLLQDKMEYGSDDLGERLGRNKKPDLEITKVGVGVDPMEEAKESSSERDRELASGEDDEAGEASEEAGKPGMSSMDMDEEMSPEDKLKSRLMKLRG